MLFMTQASQGLDDLGRRHWPSPPPLNIARLESLSHKTFLQTQELVKSDSKVAPVTISQEALFMGLGISGPYGLPPTGG